MTTFLDAAVKVGEYETSDGKKKNRYQNVGTAFVHTDGTFSVKLESWFNPAGAINEKGECWINFFARKDNKPSPHQQAKQNGYQDDGFNAPSPGLKSDSPPF